MQRLSKNIFVVTSGLVLLLLGVLANAALIRITPTGEDAAGYTLTDPVLIGPNGFRLSYISQGNGQGDILNPLILIIATLSGDPVPTLNYLDGPDSSNPESLTAVVSPGGPLRYGGMWDIATGEAGGFDGTDQRTAYQQIELTPDGSNSQNYTNWTAASGESSWDLWVFSIDFSTGTPEKLQTGQWIQLDTSTLSAGSFVIGYGCNSASNPATACDGNGDTQSTPFTFAGMVVVPEPGTLSLLGAGVLGMGLMRRKRGRKR